MLTQFREVMPLASGGMANLYRARDGQGRDVVVKRIHDHLAGDDEFVARFERETRIAGLLEHENVVRVWGQGSDDGSPYLVMERLIGLDVSALLSALAARGERLDVQAACVIAADVARGLHHAHVRRDTQGNALGVVHRDVSPRNVFVTIDGIAKVLDFGVASSAIGRVLSRAGSVRGTLGYIAPEQLAGLRIDARTDVFGLGVVLWEMLTQERLWRRPSDAETLHAIRQQSAPPPSTRAPGVSRVLDGLVLAMLAKLPEGRPRDAAEVARWLDQCAGADDAHTKVRADLATLVAARVSEGAGPATSQGGPWDDQSTAAHGLAP